MPRPHICMSCAPSDLAKLGTIRQSPQTPVARGHAKLWQKRRPNPLEASPRTMAETGQTKEIWRFGYAAQMVGARRKARGLTMRAFWCRSATACTHAIENSRPCESASPLEMTRNCERIYRRPDPLILPHRESGRMVTAGTTTFETRKMLNALPMSRR